MADKVVTQLRIDETVYKKAKYIAELELRSINNQIEYFALIGVREYEKSHGPIPLDSDV